MSGSLRKRGNKWYFSFEASTVDGKRKRIERVGGRTKKEASAALRKALTEYENAGLLFESSDISVSDYMDYWMENYVLINCRPNSIKEYTRIVNQFIKPAFGNYKLKSLTPEALQTFMNDLFNRGYSNNYLRGIRNVLSGSLKYAVFPCKFISGNPMQYVKTPKKKDYTEQEEKKTLELNEYQRILDKYPFGHKYHIVLQLAFYTGMRVSEVCALTWDNIDFQNKNISVKRILYKERSNNNWYFGPTKTQSSMRDISIGNTLLNLLKKHKKWQLENQLRYGEHYKNYYSDKSKRIYFNSDSKDELIHFVCTYENGTLVNNETMGDCGKTIKKKLGIKFKFHLLRHTHATMLIENGANMKDVQKRLGHSKLSVTMDTYAHVTQKMSQETTDIFEQATSSILSTS